MEATIDLAVVFQILKVKTEMILQLVIPHFTTLKTSDIHNIGWALATYSETIRWKFYKNDVLIQLKYLFAAIGNQE